MFQFKYLNEIIYVNTRIQLHIYTCTALDAYGLTLKEERAGRRFFKDLHNEFEPIHDLFMVYTCTTLDAYGAWFH